jgi:hypothetical protein
MKATSEIAVSGIFSSHPCNNWLIDTSEYNNKSGNILTELELTVVSPPALLIIKEFLLKK